jgi:tetratricopeptide (TPR) repeat protein
LPAGEVVSAWVTLPTGTERVRLGLELTAYLRGRGEWDLAQRVGDELAQLDLPGEQMARVKLEQGLAALHSGNLDQARQHLGRAEESATSPKVRGPVGYALAEANFYAGDFESAQELYDGFARAFPNDVHANDALERVYLLESGSPLGGGVGELPGLEALARGLYAERMELWEEAAEGARAAEVEARSADAEAEVVRAHALLLLSRAEEQRGFPEAALMAALMVADSLSENRLAPWARRRAGDLLLVAGQLDDALAQYEELLAAHPNSWLAPEVRRRVTELRAGGVP